MSTTTSFPTHYPQPPTPEQLLALQERRRCAEANPLQEGMLVPFAPLNDYSHARAQPDPSSVAVDSPVTQRPLDRELLELLANPPASRSIGVRLVEAYQEGADYFSQVWLAEVEVDGLFEGEVVVKLFTEALFPFPQGDGCLPELNRYDWWSAGTLLEAETKSYAAFRPVQGRDVPYCYGVGSFRMPWGEDAPGVFLEELGHFTTLKRACAWESTEEFNPEDMDEFFCRLVEGQSRLHALGRCFFFFTADDILLSDTKNDVHDPHFVFLGFGRSQTVEFFIEATRLEGMKLRESHPYISIGEYTSKWKKWDESHLLGTLQILLNEVFFKWLRVENGRRRLNLIRE